MSAAPRPTHVSLGKPVAVEPAFPSWQDRAPVAARSAHLRWSVSRAALARAGRAVPGSSSEIAIELDIGAAASLVAVEGTQRTTLELPTLRNAAIDWKIADGLAHLSLKSEGGTLVEAVFDAESPRSRVLYARTTLFADIGLRGGRYELAEGHAELRS